MIADYELLRLLAVLVFCGVLFIYVLQRQPRSNEDVDPMAAKLAQVQAENTELRREIERLEITVDTVLKENARLRIEIDRLNERDKVREKQMATLNDEVQMNRAELRDWQAAARSRRDA